VIRPFYRPYYAFRPRFSVSLGIFAGYPIAYPYGYVSPYGYPVAAYPYPVAAAPDYGPAPYGAPPVSAPGAVAVAPAGDPSVPADSGGISFNIAPADASVYLDGALAGTASQFSPTQPPLTIVPGTHQVEVRAPGYQTAAFEVTVNPGQVTPFEGSLQPAQ
jgi:hypothetical protein